MRRRILQILAGLFRPVALSGVILFAQGCAALAGIAAATTILTNGREFAESAVNGKKLSHIYFAKDGTAWAVEEIPPPDLSFKNGEAITTKKREVCTVEDTGQEVPCDDTEFVSNRLLKGQEPSTSTVAP
jgi:hypothetical protein